MSDTADDSKDAVSDLKDKVAEQRARINGLETHLTEVARIVEELVAQPAQTEPQPAPSGEQNGQAADAPPHILTLTGEEYHAALAKLAKWVDGYLVPSYIADRPVSPSAPWCPAWWLHPEAVARLEALWLAFTELADPDKGGLTGRGTWFRDHLDPALQQLRSPLGPFARCMTDIDYPKHSDPEDLQVARYPGPTPPG